MSVKEVNIRPKNLDYELPVRLAYQFLDRKDLVNLLGRNPYIFTVIISVDNKEQFVFGNARKHLELLQAIKQDRNSLVYLQEDLGQIHVDENAKIGLIQFAYCNGKDEVRNQEHKNLIFQSISPENFDSVIDVIYAGTRRYIYDSISRELKRKEIK
jgi:hypothetical protein